MFALCHILFRLPIREQQIRYLFFTLYFKTVKMVPAHFDGRHCGLKIQIGKKINSTYSFINRIGVLFRKMIDCRWFIKNRYLNFARVIVIFNLNDLSKRNLFFFQDIQPV